MINIDWDKLELTETEYDDMNSCNACGAENSNDVTVEDTASFHICEASTKCKLCGHEDYWGYGHFMSNDRIEGKPRGVNETTLTQTMSSMWIENYISTISIL